MRLLLLLSLSAPLLIWAGEGTKAEDQDSAHLLFAMSQALHRVNYRGTFTYRRGDQMQGIKITHGVKEGREFERMVSLNGPAREIVRDNEQVRCDFQQDENLAVDQSIYPRPFVLTDSGQLTDLEKLYQISGEKSGSIAGFGSYRLSLMPKDGYRYGYRFWIASTEPHLLLRSEMVGATGEILEQLLFTSLEILTGPPKEFAAITAQTEPSETANSSNMDVSRKFIWQVTQLPPGYRQESRRFSSMMPNEHRDGAQQKVEHHLFGDGFSSVSLFIERMADGTEVFQPVTSQMGAVSLVSYPVDGYKIVVVGEVPLATAELIAHSIKRID